MEEYNEMSYSYDPIREPFSSQCVEHSTLQLGLPALEACSFDVRQRGLAEYCRGLFSHYMGLRGRLKQMYQR